MILKHLHTRSLLILSILFLGISSQAFGQASQISFGKNRVQYKDFDWQFYETEHFRVYFYQGGQDIGKYAILSSEKCLEEVNQLLDYQMDEPLDLIVYNDISDMHQTNIGIQDGVDQISGTVQLRNNKLFVYFNGKHSDFDRQIKEGITRLYLEDLQKGSGFQEVIQNSLMMNLPNWFTTGLVKYTGTPWDTDLENDLREGILSGRFNNLNKVTPEEMELIGHSIWQYVEEEYGKDAISNLLYLTRINRSVNDGILFVTGIPMEVFLEKWFKANFNKFIQERDKFEPVDEAQFVDVKRKKAFVKYQAKLSPDGKHLAYTINDIGRWKVQVYSFEDQKTRTLWNGGFRTTSLETDLSNPMIAWEPKGKKLSIIYEKKDLFKIVHFAMPDFTKEGKPTPMPKFQKIYDFSYAEDSRNILLSGMQGSQIDVFKYYLPTTKTIQITDDFYDDLQPSFIEIDGRQGVLFISNRPNDELVEGRLDTILPNGTFDVFFYDLNSPVEKLSQISFTPFANESYPQAFTDSTFTFLSDASGIRAQYEGELQRVKVGDKKKYVYTINESLGKIDSIVIDLDFPLDSAMAAGETVKDILRESTVPVYKMQGVNHLYKKYGKNIDELIIAMPAGKQVETIKQLNNNAFILANKEFEYTRSTDSSSYILDKIEIQRQLEKLRLAKEAKIIEQPVQLNLPREALYQSKFDGWEVLSEAHALALTNTVSGDEEETGSGFKFSRTRQYFLKFMTDNFSTGLDNSLLVNNYQVFNPGNPVFQQPGMNPMLRFGITDLFENHKLYGGIRLPLFGNLNPQVGGQSLPFKIGILENMEIFLTYENFKKRLDKSLTFYHRNFNEISQINYPSIGLSTVGIVNTKTNVVETKLSYPFNQLNSLRWKIGFRNDRTIIKATDILNLNAANSSQNWVYNRFEYVHDNTIDVAQNIKYGFRANVYVEIQKEFPTREDTVLNQRVQLPIFNNSYLMLWGLDARHYTKLYKTIIWANRLAYSTSVGTKKMVYYLGGIDGMLFPNFNDETVVNLNNNYAYQTLAVNMHGFQHNIRNGNSFAVLNSELRVPIFTAFSRREIKSSLLENFQILAFLDIGTAWEGFSPFGSGNLSQEIRQNAEENPTAIARVDVFKQPIVMGFGTGVRTEVAGYFIRLDLGWGYDTGKINAPRFQVGLGYDF